MRKIICFLVLGCLLLFAGCHDVTVGYLFTDEAVYPVDKMEIYNIPDKIKELQTLLDRFNEEAAPLKAEYERLNAIFTVKNEEVNVYYRTTVEPLTDSLRSASVTEEKKEELEARLALVMPVYEGMKTDRDAAQQAVWDAEQAVNNKAHSLGIDSPVLVEKQIADLNNRILYKAPWTTSVIQGVLGTEPLMYEIAGVRNEKPENAEKFRHYLTALGGGRLQVDQKVDVPAGEYVISVRVSNEERSKVFTDIFTFIVK